MEAYQPLMYNKALYQILNESKAAEMCVKFIEIDIMAANFLRLVTLKMPCPSFYYYLNYLK